MTSAKSVKATAPITIDPNFFLPPNVIDMRYRREDEIGDPATIRGDDGEVVNVQYDEIAPSELGGEVATEDTGSQSATLSPPDSVTVISQEVRVTADGKFVVDVILEVDDIPGVINYDVRVSKA